MVLEAKQKDKIIDALLQNQANYTGTDKKYAQMYGLSSAIFSRIKGGERKGVLSDASLISIGRKLGVNVTDTADWKIVKTATLAYIHTQLAYCQLNGEARILVDEPEIGKTISAKEYMRTHTNVFYVDCSQVKTKRDFIRELARTIGVSDAGKMQDVIKDTIYSLSLIINPLIILDEAGDLSYEAWLELKRYWNALEGYCGWYMMGADGLKAKIESHVRSRKVGYAEIFSRYGGKFNQTLPTDVTKKAMYRNSEAKIVAEANLIDKTKIDTIVKDGLGLRRIAMEIKKANKKAA